MKLFVLSAFDLVSYRWKRFQVIAETEEEAIEELQTQQIPDASIDPSRDIGLVKEAELTRGSILPF